MTWIKSVKPGEASGRLKKIYQRISGPDGQIDNILMAHGLRPHSLEGHMALYKNVLHHQSNALPKALLEALGVYVSMLNDCQYCVQHHAAGLKRLLADKQRSDEILTALRAGKPEQAYGVAETLLFDYAEALTRRPSEISSPNIEALREAGYKDGEILEANQVIAYFAYANRTVLGLGVSADGEVLGLSPGGQDTDDWNHG